MGEPLLYQGFEGIISICREFNIKLNLTTNGTFPRKTAAEWARLIVPLRAMSRSPGMARPQRRRRPS